MQVILLLKIVNFIYFLFIDLLVYLFIYYYLKNGRKKKPNFNLDIQEKLRENTEEGVRSHYQQLKDASSKASIELQKNVHRNYNEFIRTSNLISGFFVFFFFSFGFFFLFEIFGKKTKKVMETDMLTVKALLNELRSVGQDLVDKYCQEEKECLFHLL